jgi:nitrogen regulatory protein P-II 1
MKLITAIVRENKLDQVREALMAAEITRITISRVSGHGRQVEEHIYRGEKVIPNLIPKVRIDIAVNDEFVKVTCDAIISSAKSDGEGELGDGKIFISPLEECIRIRTAETGSQAI